MLDNRRLLVSLAAGLVLGAAAWCWAGESETRVLSLRDAVEAALARDVLVRDAQQALEEARVALARAKALTPRLSVGSDTSAASSAGLDPQSEISGTDYSSQSYSTSVTVPMRGGMNLDLVTSASTITTNSVLRAGGGTSFTYAAASGGVGISRPLPLLRDERVLTEGGRWAAEISLQQAELAFEEAGRKVVGDTLTRFLGTVRAQRQAEIALASKGEADELLRIAEEKLKLGKLAEIEVMESRVSAESAGVASRRAQSAAESGLDELKSFLGIPLEQDIQVAQEEMTPPPGTALNASDLVERALTQRTDLKQLALGVRLADLSLRQTEAQARPGVLLSGGYARSGEAPTIGESFHDLINPSWYVGLSASTNLGHGEDRASIEGARGGLRLARLDEQVRRDEVRVEIRRLVREAQDAGENAAVLAETVKMAEENLRIRQVQFDHGLIRAIDVTQTERQLSETRNQLLNSIIDYQLATARLSLAVGELPPAVESSFTAETPFGFAQGKLRAQRADGKG